MAPGEFLVAAEYYGRWGWTTLPLLSGSKVPGTEHGHHDATTDPEVHGRWATAWRDLNIGIACGPMSGVAVVDVDPRNGGTETVQRLKADGFRFPEAPTVRSANGGWHLYLKFTDGLRNTAGKLGPGIDVKADGYVVAPPSRIGPSDAGPGGIYKWLNVPLTPELPEIPAWIIDRTTTVQAHKPFEPCRTSGFAERRLEGMAVRVAEEPEGNRNFLLFWAACTGYELVLDGTLDESKVAQRLTDAAIACGLDVHQITATISSARYRIAQKGGAL